MSSGYSSDLLKTLHEERLQRQRARRWEHPEEVDLGHGWTLRPSMECLHHETKVFHGFLLDM